MQTEFLRHLRGFLERCRASGGRLSETDIANRMHAAESVLRWAAGSWQNPSRAAVFHRVQAMIGAMVVRAIEQTSDDNCATIIIPHIKAAGRRLRTLADACLRAPRGLVPMELRRELQATLDELRPFASRNAIRRLLLFADQSERALCRAVAIHADVLFTIRDAAEEWKWMMADQQCSHAPLDELMQFAGDRALDDLNEKHARDEFHRDTQAYLAANRKPAGSMLGSSAASDVTQSGANTVSLTQLRELTDLSNTSLRRYAKAAGVKTPKVGGKNHRYLASDIRNILGKIIEDSGSDVTVRRCRVALETFAE